MSARERHLELGDLTLAAREWGEPGGERVLALHGWLDNAASFDAIAPLLDGLHLVAIDLPGHGRSAHRPPGNWYHFLDYLSDVLGAADALGWDRFTLFGHSMGGGIASILAGAAPERIDALWLIEALGPLSTEPGRTREVLAAALADRRASRAKKLRVFASVDAAINARVTAGRTGNLSEPAARRLVERGIRPVENGFTWSSDPRLTLGSALRITEPQVLNLIGGIQCPTLVIIADPLAPFLDAALLDTRTRAVPHARLQRIAGTHHLHLETPEPVAAAINAFRRRLDP